MSDNCNKKILPSSISQSYYTTNSIEDPETIENIERLRLKQQKTELMIECVKTLRGVVSGASGWFSKSSLLYFVTGCAMVTIIAVKAIDKQPIVVETPTPVDPLEMFREQNRANKDNLEGIQKIIEALKSPPSEEKYLPTDSPESVPPAQKNTPLDNPCLTPSNYQETSSFNYKKAGC